MLLFINGLSLTDHCEILDIQFDKKLNENWIQSEKENRLLFCPPVTVTHGFHVTLSNNGTDLVLFIEYIILFYFIFYRTCCVKR